MEEKPLEESALPRSIIVPRQDPRRYLRETVDSIFSDQFMAYLALLLVPIIILEFVFPTSSVEYDFLEICDWTIIVLFITEYFSKLYLAEERWVHFKSPWHLLDLVIVVIPFVQLLPFLGLKLTGSASLLLRLLRLPRVFAAAGRATSGRERAVTVTKEPEVEEPTIIRRVDASSLFTDSPAEVLTWDQLQSELLSPNQSWIDIYNISDEGFEKLSQLLQIAEPYFKSGIMDEIYPHIDYHQGASFIFLHSGEIRYPESSESFLTISRSGFVLICTSSKLISVSRHNIDLLDRLSVENLKKGAKSGKSFLVAVLYAVLDSLLNEYREMLSKIEIDLIKITNIPRNKLPRDFLERIYQLTKEVSRLDSNLVHFKDLIGIIISRQVPLAGFSKDSEDEFQLLQDSASYLREIAQGLVDNFKSIIDLYINHESFETNRVLKILAVITSVAVIPAVVSGMLGMNVLGIPFQAHLWEIAFSVGITVSFLIYAFVKLGWLKT
ncbi:MAG TPA: CorA family divalent cation transporter [Nitrososphaerales archaeon]|nr:CorA family divalent cation transporter [Nitrososphaerales archaeon]